MADKVSAPGLQWRNRANGERRAYWISRSDLIKRGYTPKCVPLHYDGNMELIEHRCRVLQAEMLEWSTNTSRQRRPFDGTVRSLVNCYEVDPDSPYHDLRPTTQKNYSKHMRILCQRVGDRQLAMVMGDDVRRWYKKIAAPDQPEGKPKLSYAYTIIGIFKAIVSWGASRGPNLMKPNPCIPLREQLSATRFKQPPARKTRLTYEQVARFRLVSIKRGRHSMARGVLLQFELAFRQRDVLGDWNNGRWSNGLTWSHIGRDGILRKTTSKTGADAEHRIADYPELAADLAATPLESRVGPLVIDEGTQLPYTPEKYRRWFRLIAREAGIPDEIWNMDARAGAVTEAYEAGSTTEGAMALATHTQVATSRRYRRAGTEQTSRVAKLRVASRTQEK
jgi:hypothetical protein